MALHAYIVGSDKKILPNTKIKKTELTKATAFRNEPFSFQLVFNTDEEKIGVFPEIKGNFKKSVISLFTVGYVPVTNCSFRGYDGDFVDKKPGLFPDILYRHKAIGKVELLKNRHNVAGRFLETKEDLFTNAIPCNQALWFTFNENGTVDAGDYKITVLLHDQRGGDVLFKETITLHVIDALLPEQKTKYTNWVHFDCLSDYYKVKMYSEKHYAIIDNFLKNANLYGQNTLLLPMFTPPLDTAIGKERKTTQLVDVVVKSGKYEFDFAKAERIVDIALKNGYVYFEHSQLFSQWGAEHTPKVVANVNGKKKTIFGWETDGLSKEYICFLKAYLPELKKFTDRKGITDKVCIHISDEPKLEEIDRYNSVMSSIRKELSPYTVADTTRDYESYEKMDDDVKLPIVRVNATKEYSEKCDNYWFYYTGGMLANNATNRIITTTSNRCRILGAQMYYFNAKGFLHWGYNYYYDVLSNGLFNPFWNPCGYETHPGTSYLAYPGTDGKPVPSLREKIMMEAMCDIRAFELLESLTSKEYVKKLFDNHFGAVTVEMTEKQTNSVVALRNLVNKEIEKQL